jgi:uncharacterized protein YjbJ (UPF0337 family)
VGILNRAKNAANKATGQAKEAVGKQTDDPYLEGEGRKDQVTSDLKNAGEHVKDAAEKVKESVSH